MALQRPFDGAVARAAFYPATHNLGCMPTFAPPPQYLLHSQSRLHHYQTSAVLFKSTFATVLFVLLSMFKIWRQLQLVFRRKRMVGSLSTVLEVVSELGHGLYEIVDRVKRIAQVYEPVFILNACPVMIDKVPRINGALRMTRG